MRTTWLFTLLFPFAAAASVAAEAPARRQLDAHVQGHGTLAIAIADNTVSLELEAPGADIAGFEHEATSDHDKAAVEAALKTLRDGATLFKLTAAAGCGLTSADAKLESEHDGEDKDGHARHDGAKHNDAKHDGAKHEAEPRHSAFRATYAFTCTAPAALTAIETGYFSTFKAAKELGVTIVAPKGQSQATLTPQNATIALGGMM
jgi:hypothetical protein